MSTTYVGSTGDISDLSPLDLFIVGCYHTIHADISITTDNDNDDKMMRFPFAAIAPLLLVE